MFDGRLPARCCNAASVVLMVAMLVRTWPRTIWQEWICDRCLKARVERECDALESASSLSSSSEEQSEEQEVQDANHALASEAAAAQTCLPLDEARPSFGPEHYLPLAQHRVRKTLHYVKDSFQPESRREGTLACGRRCSHVNYCELANYPRLAWPTCSDCFGSCDALAK
jgi:hypothetical protein